MSWREMRALLDMQAELSSAERFVLFALRVRAGDNGRCWPSQRRLALDTGLQERTVRRIVAQLELRRLVRVDRRGDDQRSHEYTLQIADIVTSIPAKEPPKKPDTGSSIAPCNGGQSGQICGHSRRQIPDTGSAEGFNLNGKEGAAHVRFSGEPRAPVQTPDEAAQLAEQMRRLRESLE